MMNGSLVNLKRGQLLTGRKALSTTSGISENIVRSILNRFELDQQITIQKTNKYSIITVLNYDEYQDINQQTTSESPTDHQQTTSQPPHIKEIKQTKEIKESRRFTPPSVDEVRLYCQERDNHIDPGNFVDFYQAKNWYIGKNKMKDWRAAVRTWEQRGKGNGKTQQQGQLGKFERAKQRIKDWEAAQSGAIIDGEIVGPHD